MIWRSQRIGQITLLDSGAISVGTALTDEGWPESFRDCPFWNRCEAISRQRIEPVSIHVSRMSGNTMNQQEMKNKTAREMQCLFQLVTCQSGRNTTSDVRVGGLNPSGRAKFQFAF